MDKSLRSFIKIKKKITKYEIEKRTGIKWATMSLWEKGVYKPSEKNAEKLEKLLGELY